MICMYLRFWIIIRGKNVFDFFINMYFWLYWPWTLFFFVKIIGLLTFWEWFFFFLAVSELFAFSMVSNIIGENLLQLIDVIIFVISNSSSPKQVTTLGSFKNPLVYRSNPLKKHMSWLAKKKIKNQNVTITIIGRVRTVKTFFVHK